MKKMLLLLLLAVLLLSACGNFAVGSVYKVDKGKFVFGTDTAQRTRDLIKNRSEVTADYNRYFMLNGGTEFRIEGKNKFKHKYKNKFYNFELIKIKVLNGDESKQTMWVTDKQIEKQAREE